jgi:hypothetical protein
LAAPAPCSAESLTRLTDAPTGIELALPLDVLISTKAGKWGTNWRSAGDRLNVDTLNFGSERRLAEAVHPDAAQCDRRLSVHLTGPL